MAEGKGTEKETATIQNRSRVASALVILLLVLRIGFLGGGRLLLVPEPHWLWPIFEAGNYLLTAMLVWWERDRLSNFHIDSLALWGIIFLKPVEITIRAVTPGLEPPLRVGLPQLVGFVLVAACLTFVVGIRPEGKLMKWRGGMRNVAMGVALGVGLSAVLALPYSLQVKPIGEPPLPNGAGLSLALAMRFVYQLGYAGVTEEPVFRGFLWGRLRQARWQEAWICLAQAALFWLAHSYYLRDLPLSFWVVVPIGSLFLGILVIRTRSIGVTMACHAAFNATLPTFGVALALLRR